MRNSGQRWSSFRVLGALLAFALVEAGVSTRVHAQVDPTAIINRVKVDTRRPIDFHAATFPDTVFVGQQTTHQTAVFLTDNARSRLRRNPEFTAPEFRRLLTYDLNAPRRILPSRAPGYEAHVFQRALFPVADGAVVVPAPQLSYALPASSSYFSREERFTVKAESTLLVVKPLPVEGRPESFSGAVGVLNVMSRIDTLNARVGDPVVFTLRVQGVGNVKLFPRPVVEIDWASTVPGTERVRVDTTGPLVRGYKEFDWILTPTREGSVTLPSFTYDYFDPYKREYAAAVTLPITLAVGAGALAAAEPGESAALLPLRTAVTQRVLERGVPLDGRYAQLAILILALLAPIPAVALAFRRREPRLRKVMPATPGAAMRIDALRRLTFDPANPSDHARTARRELHVALADRLGVTTQTLTSRRQVRRVLRRRGVTRAGTACVIELLEDLDTQGFAGGNEPNGAATFAERAASCFAIVDQEAVRSRESLPRDTMTSEASRSAFSRNRTGLLVLVASLSALALPLSTTTAQQGDAGGMRQPVQVTLSGANTETAEPSAELVRAATDAYQSRLFTDAEQRFADLVRAHPRDVSLLVNWGAAAWSAGDTVNAVIAWQRAARLEPLAADVQERLMLLPSGARGGIADVPMVPVPFLQTLAIVLWLIGWGVAALLEVRRRRNAGHAHTTRWTGVLGGVVWTCLLCAIAAAGFSLWGRRALDTGRLAVVARPETMHVAPGGDSDAMGGVATGDIVSRLEEQGGWERVMHSDGRQGWIPSTRLVALGDRSAGASAGDMDSIDSLAAPAARSIELAPVTDLPRPR